MLALLDTLRRRSSLKRIVRRLGPLMVTRYGYDGTYSIGRILTAYELLKLPHCFRIYACAMLGERPAFVQWQLEEQDAALDGALLHPEVLPQPYRSGLLSSDARPQCSAARLTVLYDELRREVADAANGGSLRFHHPPERSFEQWTPIANEHATGFRGLPV